MRAEHFTAGVVDYRSVLDPMFDVYFQRLFLVHHEPKYFADLERKISQFFNHGNLKLGILVFVVKSTSSVLIGLTCPFTEWIQRKHLRYQYLNIVRISNDFKTHIN